MINESTSYLDKTLVTEVWKKKDDLISAIYFIQNSFRHDLNKIFREHNNLNKREMAVNQFNQVAGLI